MSSHRLLGEREVRVERGGTRRITKRVGFEVYGRFLGTETVRREWFEGEYRGWSWVEESPGTVAFHTLEELREWLDDLTRQHEVDQVKANGGTKLVILT